MKILYLSFDRGIPYWGTKGASVHVREFVKASEARGHQVETFIANLGDRAESAPNVHQLPRPSSEFFQDAKDATDRSVRSDAFSFAWNFTDWTPSDFDSDLVYERYSLFGISGLSVARTFGVPFVLEVNSPLVIEQKRYRELALEPLTRSIESHLFSQADLIVAVSQVISDYVLHVCPSASTMVLPNGVDGDLFSNAQVFRPIKKALGEDSFLIGFVGSLKPWHGLENLMESFCGLPRDSSIKLVIVGDGPMKKDLEAVAKKNGVSESVAFVGAVDHEDVAAILKSCDVAVAPYPEMKDFYFSPLKIFEYMASGRPIVASKIGQVTELLEDGENALLVPPGDIEALTQALIRLNAEPELRQRLGRNAQKAATESHSWSSRIATLETAFADLVEGKRQPAMLHI